MYGTGFTNLVKPGSLTVNWLIYIMILKPLKSEDLVELCVLIVYRFHAIKEHQKHVSKKLFVI